MSDPCWPSPALHRETLSIPISEEICSRCKTAQMLRIQFWLTLSSRQHLPEGVPRWEQEERSGLTYNEELVLEGLPGDRGLPSVPDLSWPVQPACFSWRQPEVSDGFQTHHWSNTLTSRGGLRFSPQLFHSASQRQRGGSGRVKVKMEAQGYT